MKTWAASAQLCDVQHSFTLAWTGQGPDNQCAESDILSTAHANVSVSAWSMIDSTYICRDFSAEGRRLVGRADITNRSYGSGAVSSPLGGELAEGLPAVACGRERKVEKFSPLEDAGVLLVSNSQLLANYLEAFGTIGAVIIALFTQVYLAWRKRPQLTIKSPTGDTSPESKDDLVVIRSAEDVDEKVIEFWVRLRV